MLKLQISLIVLQLTVSAVYGSTIEQVSNFHVYSVEDNLAAA